MINTDGNLYALRQHEAKEEAESKRDQRIEDLANKLAKSEGDFENALFTALESGKLIKSLNEMFIEGRRKDFGIELCEKIDDELKAEAEKDLWLEEE